MDMLQPPLRHRRSEYGDEVGVEKKSGMDLEPDLDSEMEGSSSFWKHRERIWTWYSSTESTR